MLRRSFLGLAVLLPNLNKALWGPSDTGDAQGRKRMSSPQVQVTLDADGYNVGENLTASANVSDADNQTVTIDPPAFTDPETGLSVDSFQTVQYTENFDYEWLVNGVVAATGANVRTVPDLSFMVTADFVGQLNIGCHVTDAQGNEASDSVSTTVTDPTPPAPALVLGCAIGALPSPSTLTRVQRWAAFQNDIKAANGGVMPPHVLRVYLDPGKTEAMIDAWEAQPGRTDLWALMSNTPNSAGDIWTPGTPHPHDILLSLKVNHSQMAQGRYDEFLRALYAQYLDLDTLLGRIRVAFNHEPYDDIYKSGSLTLSDWKATNTRAMNIAYEFDHVDPWIVLTGEQFDPVNAGTNKGPDNFWIPGMKGVAGDRYQVPSSRHDGTTWWTDEYMFDHYVAWCQSKGCEAGLWEYGCMPDFNNLTKKSQDMIAVKGYSEANGIVVLSWFDNYGPKGDWYVDAIVHRTSYYPNTIGTVVPPITTDAASANTWHSLFAQ